MCLFSRPAPPPPPPPPPPSPSPAPKPPPEVSFGSNEEVRKRNNKRRKDTGPRSPFAIDTQVSEKEAGKGLQIKQ